MQHDNYFDSLRVKEAREEAASARRENAILQGEINRLKMLFLDTLPHKLKHGDADHQRWLDEAIIATWNGDDPPKPYGKANWETERARLQAENGRLRLALTKIQEGSDCNTQTQMCFNDHENGYCPVILARQALTEPEKGSV